MFELIPAPKGDPILSLITEFMNDNRDERIDLGVGVYKNNHGITPVMGAVLEAEKRLIETEGSKSYQGLTGDVEFNKAIQALLLDGTEAFNRTATLQTPGASGALRMIADLLASTKPNTTVWISNPSYVNHKPIMETAGLTVKEYPYLNPETKAVDEQRMLEQVELLGKDDVLLLHGCCHNPSGADISFELWEKITKLANQNGFIPLVDIAYQGLGDGLEADGKGLRHLVDGVDECLISTSCSKNFGLYRERTGAVMVVGKTLEHAMNARGKMCNLARGSYSMPPSHGAAIVTCILNDKHLTTMWRSELDSMNDRINGLRHALVKQFQVATNSNRFDYFGEHKGMFTLTGLADEKITQLKTDHAIYIVGGGRINIAGLKESDVNTLVDAFVKIGA